MAETYFLKLDGVPGNSKKPRHIGEIEVLGVSFGNSSGLEVINSGGGAVKFDGINHSDIAITKKQDSTSTRLLEIVTTGKSISNGTLTYEKLSEKGGVISFFSIFMTDIVISSFHYGGRIDPVDTITLLAAKIEYKHSTDEK